MSEEIPEALRPGAKSRWSRAITEDDVLRFAELSGDKGRHHRERDALGRLVAHGLLTATLPTKLGGDMDYMAKEMRFEFVKAVFTGDVLDCEGTVENVIVQNARFKMSFSFVVTNQDGDVVLRGTTSGQILR